MANHEELFSHVKSRYSGGLAGEGDLQQALERVEAAKAARADFQRSLDDARSKYRKIIGIEAFNVVFPGPLRGLPRSKDDALRPAALHAINTTSARIECPLWVKSRYAAHKPMSAKGQ